MVYLFHFELPVTEATWTNFATIYRPYLKSFTFSEVDGYASGVMHLSRACDGMVRSPGGSPEGRGEIDDNDDNNGNDIDDDDGESNGKSNENSVDESVDEKKTIIRSVDDHSAVYSAITFMTYFYVNTKKGKKKKELKIMKTFIGRFIHQMAST